MTEQETRQIERQQRLEIEMVQIGAQSWRAAENRKEAQARERKETHLGETSGGKRMMKAIMPKLVEGFRQRQREALENLTNGKGGRPPLWAGPVLCLSAEKIAVITLRTTITDVHRFVQGLILTISSRVMQEREFEILVENERKRVKEGRLSSYEQLRGFDKPVSVVQVMKDYAKTVDARTVKKWSAKVDHVEKLEWEVEEQLAFGAMCLWTLVEAAPDWFQEMEYVKRSRGQVQTVKYIGLTDQAEEFLRHQKEVDEVAHPWMIPMITKPRRWTREEN